MKLRFLRPVPRVFPITSTYGRLRTLTINGQTTKKTHLGIDIGCPVGTPVAAPRAGEVIRAGWQNPNNPKEGYGLRVMLKVKEGEETVYCYLAHLNEIHVGQGDLIKEGQILGLSGNTGSSTGPHVHIEARASDMAERYDMEFYESPQAVA